MLRYFLYRELGRELLMVVIYSLFAELCSLPRRCAGLHWRQGGLIENRGSSQMSTRTTMPGTGKCSIEAAKTLFCKTKL